jgi:3-hydroxybutyryl-CoA dehydratase
METYRFSELSLGQRASFEVDVTEAMLDAFAGLCGDRNPLHMDAAFAARAGHPARLAHGLLTASFFSTMAGMHLPGEQALLHEVKVGFKKPVYPGMRLSVEGTVVGLQEAFRQVEVKVSVRDSAGNAVASGSYKAGVGA